jgi:hypothetical protein
MATTLTATTATITTTISYTNGGGTWNKSFVDTVATNKAPISQIIPVTTTVISILMVDASLGPGNLLSLKRIVFKNWDDTNVVRLGFLTTGGDVFYVVVPAGQTFVFGDIRTDVNLTGAAAAALAAMTSIDTITAQADTASVDLEVIAWA